MLRKLLFYGTLVIAFALWMLVILAPEISGMMAEPREPTVLKLFGFDPVLRRITMACAFGMAIAACIFFRDRKPEKERKQPS